MNLNAWTLMGKSGINMKLQCIHRHTHNYNQNKIFEIELSTRRLNLLDVNTILRKPD